MSESTHDRPVATTTAAAKERASAAAEELTARTGADSFDAAVVLGSGWGVLADRLGTADTEVDAGELPGFTAPSAPEHSSLVRSVWVGSKRVALFGGRVHLFETRDPLLAVHAVRTAIAAGAGADYTLLTGAEVPTVRSCIGAVLVLIALALGREPLSMRMVAVAAIAVLLLWPESLVGPSFQMSFAAVLAIVALHGSAPVQAFLAPREENSIVRFARRAAMLLIMGIVIEIALMPIVLFHFHRAGLYGALANVIAIPLVTFVSMPLIALALLLDLVGAGAPVWWLAGKSLELLLAIAHFTAAQPGAVKLAPQMGLATIALFVIGGLWLALWRGRTRLLGLVPAAFGTILLIGTPAPDVLISGDGRHVGIAGEGDRLLMLRDTRSEFARDNLLELAGLEGEPVPLSRWAGARCSRDFCTLAVDRGERRWTLLMARGRDMVEERALAAACDRVDIVVADRFLPRSCRPRWLKADRRLLSRTGGLALHLDEPRMEAVAEGQGEHGWWRGTRR